MIGYCPTLESTAAAVDAENGPPLTASAGVSPSCVSSPTNVMGKGGFGSPYVRDWSGVVIVSVGWA